jgi:hypothetical protein
MTEFQQALWQKIKRFEVGDPMAAFSFSGRLARENGWEVDYAERVVMEYKRFLFLASISPLPVTPSDQVDQAWHLHLLYTESYWQELCGSILPRPVNHGPTKGGQQENDKFEDWYERTKAFYREVFDRVPPEDIWPSSEIRFGEINFKRVNLDHHWIIRKPKWLRTWKFWKN